MENMTIDIEPTAATSESPAADFVAMPDLEGNSDENDRKAPIGSDSASLREAAERRSGPQDQPIVREYRDQDGKPVPQNEAITLARASRDYSGALAADRLVAESETSKDLAARVDALRAQALAHDPEAAEFYGFELPEGKPDKAESEDAKSEGSIGETAEPDDSRTAAGLTPEVEIALRDPQVRQAFEEQLGEVEKARQEYLGGLSAATQIAQMSFLSQFPELAGVAPEQLPGALEQLAKQDPAKFARVQELVAVGERLLAQQALEGQRQAEIAQQSFRNYARAEDARLETMLKGEPRETQHAVANEIVASARSSGIETNELISLFNSEPLMRNAVFQRMMYDAGKYRLMMKAKDAAAAKSLPPVLRPGTAQTRAERESADLRTLSTRLSNSGDIKDAVALYHARKSTGGRDYRR
jgi:hypothetical protein